MRADDVTQPNTSASVGSDEANRILRQMRWARAREHAGGILLTAYLVLCAVPALFGIFAIISSLITE